MRKRSNQLSNKEIYQGLLDENPHILNFFYNSLWKSIYAHFENKYTTFQLQQLRDCFPEAFLIFLNKIKSPGFKPANLKGFAFVIIQNKFKDQFKRKSFIYPYAPENLPDQPNVSITWPLSAKEWVESLSNTRLHTWFYQLSNQEKEILDLRIKNFKQKEIADSLNLTSGYVRNINSRLIKEARRIINPQ